MITSIYFLIDETIKEIGTALKPGPRGKLTESEVITIRVMHPILMPFCDLKRYYRNIENNYGYLFPSLPCYKRMIRVFEQNKNLLERIMKALSSNSFGLIVEGTTVSVMEAIRGKDSGMQEKCSVQVKHNGIMVFC